MCVPKTFRIFSAFLIFLSAVSTGYVASGKTAPKIGLPAATFARTASGAASFDFAGSLVDGAAPTALIWTRTNTAPVNRLDLSFEYTAFSPSYTSELAIRIEHAASGFVLTIGGNGGCAAFGPCDFRPQWPAAPGTVMESFSVDPLIVDASGDWNITLLDSFDDAGVDGEFLAALLTLSFQESEPDDDFAAAVVLDCDDGRLAQILPAGDIDFYRADGTPGTALRIDIDANELGSPLDSLIEAYRGDMSFITGNDDATAPGEPASLDSFLQLLFPADGRIFVSVASLNAASSGFYRLTARCPPLLDVNEPNNTAATATATSCNTVLHGHLEGAGDVDYYKISALPGEMISADVDSAAFGGLDPVLGAFDASLGALGVSDDNPAPGEPATLESYLEVLTPGDGTILLAVTSYDDFDFDGFSDQGRNQSIGPYTLELSGVCATPDGSAADSDGDGIADSTDNCIDHANPAQTDVDGDGIGNRCDPDFDNSGLVNFADLERMRSGFFGTDTLLDLNSDGIVNFLDLNIMRSFFFGPPGPSAAGRDDDGDGWDDARDFCLSTPAGSSQIVPGCSLLEAVQQPELFTTPLTAALTSLSNDLVTQGMGDLPAVADGLNQLLNSFFVATRQIRDGQLCEGRDLLSQGIADHYPPALALLEEYVGDFQDNIAPLPPSADPVDGGAVESTLMTLLYWRSQLGALGADLSEMESFFDSLCVSGVTLPPIVVTVAEITDHLRRFTDSDGAVFAFSDQLDTAQPIRSGAEVIVSGIDFGDGTYVSNDLSPVAFEPPMLAPPNPCLELRVAPRQPMTPLFPGPYELLPLPGYTSAGILRLEKDQRLAVVDTGCPTSSALGFLRHSVKIRMNYVDQTFSNRMTVLSHDLTTTHPPVSLPSSISSATASLYVQHRVQVCTVPGLPFNCGDPLVYDEDFYQVKAFDRGSLCEAGMADTEFALPDGNPATSQFSVTRVNELYLSESTDPGSFLLFSARGYSVDGGQSSYPAEKLIISNRDFAVYNFDSYSSSGPIFATDYTGVQRPSPLTWPSVMALRNGKLFRYSCEMPDIVRDVISFCPFIEPAYYRFPFSGGWLVTQGNFGTFSHNTAGYEHAWDIGMYNNTILRAARGGTVIEAVDSGSTACPNAPSTCVGNRVKIRHIDGSIGNYFHINFNGALVNVGDKVVRGQAIANSDNTGFSTGPHLHFEVLNETQTGTVPSRFTGNIGVVPVPVSCYVPVYGDLLRGD